MGQMEQQSNALALQQLGYASVTKTLDVETIGKWLSQPKPGPIPYPNVAQALVEWRLTSRGDNLQAVQEKLWQDCRERNPRRSVAGRPRLCLTLPRCAFPSAVGR